MVFISIVLSLITAGITIGYFGKKNFNQYLDAKMLKEFSMMAESLGVFYEANDGFDSIKKGDVSLHMAFSAGGKQMDGDKSIPLISPKPPEPEEHTGRDEKQRKEIFTIFDKQMNYIAGGNNNPEDMHIFPVNANGETVALFGALKREKMPDPFAEGFLARQAWLVLVTTLIVTVLSTIMALFLTANMLAPIRELKKAAGRVAGRDFDVDINIRTNDELADLGDDFNSMVGTLKEYEQKQSRWISDISHELRTPLSVILGSIEAVQDGVRQADNDTMDSLYRNAVRVKRLVNELHDITLAESGVMHMQKVSADLLNELISMLDFYEVRLSEGGFRAQFTGPEKARPVMADLMRMNQVFINILENTIKYAKSPGVLYVRYNEEPGWTVITFEDTGPGVADEHLPLLFDRLYRVDSSRSRTTGGSGLGLSICKYIVENHGGTITARRGEMGGLKMTIKLPQETEDEQKGTDNRG